VGADGRSPSRASARDDPRRPSGGSRRCLSLSPRLSAARACAPRRAAFPPAAAPPRPGWASWAGAVWVCGRGGGSPPTPARWPAPGSALGAALGGDAGDPRGQVPHPHTRFGLVLLLPAGADDLNGVIRSPGRGARGGQERHGGDSLRTGSGNARRRASSRRACQRSARPPCGSGAVLAPPCRGQRHARRCRARA